MDPNNPDIWTPQPGEQQRPGLRHFILTLVLFSTGALVGAFGQFTLPLSFGVNFFWPGIAVQNVGGIWFGAWGVLAGALFPIISNGIDGTPILISLAYIPANTLQAFLPAWGFRVFRADPRLTTPRDWGVFLLTITIANALGALWSSMIVLRGFGLLDTGSVFLFIWGWFAGNEIAGIVFGVLLLKTFSGLVMASRLFVRRWFA
ncbi:MAG: hypothetical protein Kow00124_11480 [Anaerolineae bacterium]